MKETTTRKTIMKQGRDLKQTPLTGLKSAMAAPRKPLIKEAFLPRTVSHRCTELPSLRYGFSPNQKPYGARESGPLRVSVSYENNFTDSSVKKKGLTCRKTHGSSSSSIHGNCTGSSLTDYYGEAPQPVRRVHFAELPPKSNSFADFGGFKERSEGRKGGGDEDEGGEREGTENWMRSRVGIPFIDGNSVSSSSRFARHGVTASSSASAISNLASSTVKSAPFKLGNNGNPPLNCGTIFTNPGTLKHVIRGTAGHDTGRYRHGTLTQAPTSQVPAVLRTARNGDDEELAEVLRKATIFGISPDELNAVDSSGRTALSYIASNGTLSNLKAILQLPKIDVNKQDNEGNTPLHFAAQAGHVDVINYMLSVCTGLEVDARNSLGFTPLMKAALQGRTKCARLLLFAGASPTLRDSGRGLRAEQWAKFCGRYVCADVIEKFTKNKLLDRNTSYGRWGSEPELVAAINSSKPSSTIQNQNSSSIKSRLRKAFRTMSHPGSEACEKQFSVVSQLTSAALCASSPVLQSSVSPSVKSLMRPLSVPKVQVTLASNSNYQDDFESSLQHSSSDVSKGTSNRPANRSKKKK